MQDWLSEAELLLVDADGRVAVVVMLLVASSMEPYSMLVKGFPQEN
jgi:hypothetical protein